MRVMSQKSVVPVFSFTDLQRGFYSDEFLTCLSEKGLFYLKDYGMLESENELVKQTTVNFFENGDEEQQSTVIKTQHGVRRGFSKLESESTAQITNSGSYPDYSMCYSMGLTDNVFPSPEFEQIWTNYFNQMYSRSQAVAKIVLQATGANCGESLEDFLNCDPVLRFRYFPEVPEERCSEYVPLRMAPHYDLSIVTLINQTPCANGFVSLQFEDAGTYVDLPYVPYTVLVMCGAVATIVSNGKIKAPIHRVSAPASNQRIGSSRTSSVFFLRPKSSFQFSVQKAKEFGFNVILNSETATFKEWIGGNYEELNTQKNE